VQPIVTPEEMRRFDAEAPDPAPVLIERAGAAVARRALVMLGGTYGRRVVVVAGHGTNGLDGRVAARRLAARGVAVEVIDAARAEGCRLPVADLVIDAAYGTGFRGQWHSPDPGSAAVLAVDLPSGVDGLTGAASGTVRPADATVTFAAWKPGLLLGAGPRLSGTVEVADIGLPTPGVRAHVVERHDVAQWCPPRARDAHKWRHAVRVIAGSTGMLGAAHLTAAAAMRTGAGMVHLSTPGVVADPLRPAEVVGVPLGGVAWADDVVAGLDRFGALVVGPGLGRADDIMRETRRLAVAAPVPTVIDGDGLFALAWHAEGARHLLRQRSAPTVLTPHDGEVALLTGQRPGPDRLAVARQLAHDLHSVVLLKGQVTVVAAPDGDALVVTSGDERLATAGTGDVLAGMVAALLSRGVPALHAAASAAWLHGVAARNGPRVGLVAGDLLGLVPQALAEVERAHGR
jgi:ADP-dependent NAD(P)H-hydrate dehydratase / NAD(P)H-hydrate epimerase